MITVKTMFAAIGIIIGLFGMFVGFILLGAVAAAFIQGTLF